MPHADSSHERVTVSLGVVAFQPKGDESMLALIRRADEALYQAKHQGRNALVTKTLVTAPERPRLSLSA
jgi:diguanylate cyclase (GGDEF)-like protein